MVTDCHGIRQELHRLMIRALETTPPIGDKSRRERLQEYFRHLAKHIGCLDGEEYHKAVHRLIAHYDVAKCRADRPCKPPTPAAESPGRTLADQLAVIDLAIRNPWILPPSEAYQAARQKVLPHARRPAR